MQSSNVPTSKPDSEPVTLALVKLHCAIDHTDEDELIVRQIKSARVLCENYTGRIFGSRSFTMRLECWPSDGYIYFPVEPVSEVSSMSYVDELGASVAVDAGQWKTWLDRSPPVAKLVSGFAYPSLNRDEPAPVSVVYTAGAGEVPETVEQAIELIVNYWRANPGGEVSLGHLSLGMPAGAIRLLDFLWTGA